MKLSKNEFFDRMTSGLHASLRSTPRRIKVFFPPYMPPEKMDLIDSAGNRRACRGRESRTLSTGLLDGKRPPVGYANYLRKINPTKIIIAYFTTRYKRFRMKRTEPE